VELLPTCAGDDIVMKSQGFPLAFARIVAQVSSALSRCAGDIVTNSLYKIGQLLLKNSHFLPPNVYLHARFLSNEVGIVKFCATQKCAK
jgi:hypothetical protein